MRQLRLPACQPMCPTSSGWSTCEFVARFTGHMQGDRAMHRDLGTPDVDLSSDGLPEAVGVTGSPGDDAFIVPRLCPDELITQVPSNQRPAANEAVRISITRKHPHLFDATSG